MPLLRNPLPQRSLLSALLIGASLTLAACGGSGGGSGGGSTQAPATDPTARTTGPLDPVQTTLEGAVFNPLANALAGTPLEGVVDCANEIINREVLDTVDTLANALALSANPSDLTALEMDPLLLTERVRALAFDVTQLVLALDGSGTACLTQGSSAVFGNAEAQSFLSGSNPLAGTPFEDFSALLSPALNQLLTATGGTRPDDTLSTDAVTSAFQQFNTAFQTALATLPVEVEDAPVVGGILASVGTSINDLSAVFGQLSAFNPTGVQAALTALLSNVAGNVTGGLIPLDALDGLLGEPGAFSALNSVQVADFGSLLSGQFFGSNTGGSPLSLIQGVLAPVALPVIGPILADLTALLGGNPLGGGLTGDQLTNTPLAPVVDAIQGVLTGLLAVAPGDEGEPGQTCLLFLCVPSLL